MCNIMSLQKPCPEKDATFISKILFLWITR